jgi:hypothetical protein
MAAQDMDTAVVADMQDIPGTPAEHADTAVAQLVAIAVARRVDSAAAQPAAVVAAASMVEAAADTGKQNCSRLISPAASAAGLFYWPGTALFCSKLGHLPFRLGTLVKLTLVRSTRLALAIACTVLLASTLAAQSEADKAFVQRGMKSYYGLTREGLQGYSCSAIPNWQVILGDQLKGDPAAAESALTTLRAIHFNVSVNSAGKATVTHNDATAPNDAMANAFKQIYGGMQQMIGGFYDTTALFLFNTPFPAADSAFKLEKQGAQYRLSYKEGDAQVATTLDSDFAVSSLNVTGADFTSQIQPTFTKTDKGLLLASYQATYQPKPTGDAAVISVHWDYQLVDGFQLPKTLGLSGTSGSSPFTSEILLSDCQVTKK